MGILLAFAYMATQVALAQIMYGDSRYVDIRHVELRCTCVLYLSHERIHLYIYTTNP